MLFIRALLFNFLFALLMTFIYFIILIGYKDILSLTFLYVFFIILITTTILDVASPLVDLFLFIVNGIIKMLGFIPIAGTIIIILSEIIVSFIFGIVLFVLISIILNYFNLGILLSLFDIFKILSISLIYGILWSHGRFLSIGSQKLFGM